MTNEIQKSLADLQAELNKLAPAVKHIEDASIVAKNVAGISKSFVDSSKVIEQIIIKEFGQNVIDKSANHLNSLNSHIEQLDIQIKKLENLKFKDVFDKIQVDFLKQAKNALSIELEKINQVLFWLKDELNVEIERIQSVDFEKQFESLQKSFIKTAQKDIKIELDKLDVKLVDLENQIKRLESIDLESEFKKLQRTLSDIFTAVNSINLTLTKITQNVSDIFSRLSILQEQFKEDAIRINKSILDFKKNIKQELLDDRETAQQNNEKILKGIKSNRLVIIIGIGLILAIQILLKFVHFRI